MGAIKSLLTAACLIGMMTTACSAPSSATQPLTAVITAYPPEWEALLPHLEGRQNVFAAGVHFVRGVVADSPVLVVESGIGPVNAAAAVQVAIYRFGAGRIVVEGISGAVDSSLHIGDVVIPDRWGDPLFSVMARRDGASYALPTYPFVTNRSEHLGMIYPQLIPVGHAPEPSEQARWIEADPELLNVARNTCGFRFWHDMLHRVDV
ncbi:MAG: hypothetical protein ACRYGP_26925 [Janthinobacterium lividum]